MKNGPWGRFSLVRMHLSIRKIRLGARMQLHHRRFELAFAKQGDDV
ncbi:MAG: hypothetical protein K0S28_1585 [Paucimonas sp.]|nr:hypothetical protein [Paucimonas sp.]